MSEVIAEENGYRVILEPDADAGEPYDESASPLLRVENLRAVHVGSVPQPYESEVEETAERLFARNRAETALKIFEGYLRKRHYAESVVSWYSGSYWYVTYDPGWWRQATGAPRGCANLDDYKAWVEGDTWSWAIEKLGDDGWNDIDGCGGFYGYAYAEESAREEFESLMRYVRALNREKGPANR